LGGTMDCAKEADATHPSNRRRRSSACPLRPQRPKGRPVETTTFPGLINWRGAAAPLANRRACESDPDFFSGKPCIFGLSFQTMGSSSGISRASTCTDGMHNLKQEPSDDGEPIPHGDLCAESPVGRSARLFWQVSHFNAR
jgi:hypothetical protein